MSIIEGGVTLYIGECPVCGCKFDYFFEELMNINGKHYVRCPYCKEVMEHNVQTTIKYRNVKKGN